MIHAITFENVVKTYGSHKALNGLNLSFEKGKVTALLGPNGAGKTTAVSLLLNLIKPTFGRITVEDWSPGHKELKERIGAMLQETPTPDGLSVRETLELFRSYYRQPLSLERLLQIAGLEKEAKQRASSLSGGQKRRLAFAMALAGDPEIIVLDEPTVGMDVEARIRFWNVVRTLAKGNRTILLTTHYLEEADAVADHIVVIAEGNLIAEGTPDQLKSTMPLKKITFKASIIPGPSLLSALPGARDVEIHGNTIQLLTTDSDKVLQIIMNWHVSDIQIHAASLESVFRQLTKVENTDEQVGVIEG